MSNGCRPQSDVDQLVKMINVGGPQRQLNCDVDNKLKKAAKKARQKLRKKEEKIQSEMESEHNIVNINSRFNQHSANQNIDQTVEWMKHLNLSKTSSYSQQELRENEVPRCNSSAFGIPRDRNTLVPKTRPDHNVSVQRERGDMGAVIRLSNSFQGNDIGLQNQVNRTCNCHGQRVESPPYNVISSDSAGRNAYTLNGGKPHNVSINETKTTESSRNRTKKGKSKRSQQSNANKKDSLPVKPTEEETSSIYKKVCDDQLSSMASSAAKPEMVTIRRHPTVSDTTVTISIKNQRGEEDILYTLLNGQVVRSKPEVVDIDMFIHEDKVNKDTTAASNGPALSASKKRKNRKKNSKMRNEGKTSEPTCVPEVKKHPEPQLPVIPSPAPHPPVQQWNSNNTSNDNNVVICTPILPSTSPVTPPKQEEVVRPSSSSITENYGGSLRYFQELQEDAEIDLTKLKLPPGITITKVNQFQPVSNFGGLASKVEKSHQPGAFNSAEGGGMHKPKAPMSNSFPGGYIHGVCDPNGSIYADGFNSKSNVIVVDSQSCHLDHVEKKAEILTSGDFMGLTNHQQVTSSSINNNKPDAVRTDRQRRTKRKTSGKST